MQSIRLPLNLDKVLRFLDRPYMWILYFIITMYIVFFGTFILRGIVQYNKVLNVIETTYIIDSNTINKELSNKGFTVTWGTTPTIKDYFKAGFLH
jgi:hypothetical protein